MSETSASQVSEPNKAAAEDTAARLGSAARRIVWRGGVPMGWKETFDDELCGLVSDAYADARAMRRASDDASEDDFDADTFARAQQLRGNLFGLALSGGGIRSASFALGVLQAFIRFDVAERFHYLSSVSGGGYMGVALAWLRKRAMGDWKQSDWKQQLSRVASGARVPPAPSVLDKAAAKGSEKSAASGTENVERVPTQSAQGNAPVDEDERLIWLDYVRQHGNFLQPPGMSTLALVAVALRNAVMSAGIYFLLLTLLLGLLMKLAIVPDAAAFAPGAFCRGYAIAGLHPVICYDALSLLTMCATAVAILFVGFSLASFVLSFENFWRLLWATAAAALFAGLLSFALQPTFLSQANFLPPITSGFDRLMAWSLLLPALFALSLSVWIAMRTAWNWVRTTWKARKRTEPPARHSDSWAYRMRLRFQMLTGTLAALLIVLALLLALPWAFALVEEPGVLSISALAAAGAIYQAFWSGTRSLPRSMTTRVRLLVTACLVLAAAALASYALARRFDASAAALGASALVVIAVAFCTNLNQFGLGRMYRDRLMESFMPNLDGIEQTQWEIATDADGSQFGLLQDLWPAAKNCPDRLKLYPLINTNVVLVDSKIDTYRGRGGDSFVLSPGACGSDATRWVETRHFADEELTAATAMAASGAAANPNTGPAGRGVTRNRLVSFLMFLMQARLGVWVRNPWFRFDLFPSRQARIDDWPPLLGWRRWVDALLVWVTTRLLGQRPNFVVPGVRSGLFGRGLSERSYFLELTDGGHFDNTGVYELVRRRARLIVLAQASQDESGGMADLANVTEKIRVDFGVHLRFDDGLSLSALVPRPPAHEFDRPCAERGHAIARILYPASGKDGETCGWLVYLQATPVSNLPVDTQSYRHYHPAFPNESTADQFFDEAQLEAYRELGYAIAKRFLTEVVHAQPIDGDERAASFEPGHALADVYRLLQPVPEVGMTLDPPDEPDALQTSPGPFATRAASKRR